MKHLGNFFGVVVILLLTSLFNGFVLSKLWAWLIVTTFQVQSITLVQAIGISVLMNYMMLKRTRVKEENDGFWAEMTKDVSHAVLNGLFMLLFGYIVYLSM
jgi:hypothetical protein